MSLLLAGSTVSRAGAPPGRYTVARDTVLDTKTGLAWQRVPSPNAMSLTAAGPYCAGLTLGGVSGWRVPRIRELLTLVDVRSRNPSIDSAAFPGTSSTEFWTISPTLQQGDFFFVKFDLGLIGFAPDSYAYEVRCVR